MEPDVKRPPVRPINVALTAILMMLLACLVIYDHQRVHTEFLDLKTALRQVRQLTISSQSRLVAQFEEKELAVRAFPHGQLLQARHYSTLHKVHYETTVGDNRIVFDGGTTGRFNRRLHGGEIELRSWFGFRRFIHVNCAGLVIAGRCPQA